MKRIEFLAPVEAMRGNLSGAQNLKYPTDNNKAFESPEGSVNYARNYSTRFIGAKRASDGLKYFAVKTKTATHITTRSLMAMALLGAAGAMYAALVRDKASASYTGIYAQWVELQNYGNTKSFRSYVMDNFRQMLATKSSTAVFAGPRPAVTINNPWEGEQTADVTISREILVKFWPQLATNGIVFSIDGIKVACNDGDEFVDLIANTINQGLALTEDAQNYILMGGRYVLDSAGEYITSDYVPAPNAKYYTTDIAPA